MRHIAFATSLICCLSTYHEATAQGFWYVPPGADLSYRYGIDLGNGFGFGYGFGYGYGSIETPYAAAASAAGDLLQYQSQNDAMAPQTMTNEQDEDSEGIKDLQQRTAEFRAKQRSLKFQQAKVEKDAKAEKDVITAPGDIQGSRASPGSPARLTGSQFDPSTGKIVWPSVLLRDSFSFQRYEVESLLESLAESCDTSELSARIARKSQEMHQELRKQIRGIPIKDYLEAHNFLKRLAPAGQFPVS